MTNNELIKLIQDIVSESKRLSEKYISKETLLVNYACVFTQNIEEYETIIKTTKQIGKVIKATTMGPIFLISPIETIAGNLKILKIRKPDPKRTEKWDADFTISDYNTFKQRYLNTTGFNLIVRPEMEMIELVDTSFDVIAYYSHPIIAEILNIKIN